MQTKIPIAVAVFQIPNVADQQTSDSTNLAISLYDNSDRARQAFELAPKNYSDSPLVASELSG